MANLTLAVDDSLLQAARTYAQAHGTTVNALVRDLLERTVTVEDSANFAAFLRQISEKAKPDSDWRFNRRSMYDERDEELEKRRRRNSRLNEK
jgi:hypothetical protein